MRPRRSPDVAEVVSRAISRDLAQLEQELVVEEDDGGDLERAPEPRMYDLMVGAESHLVSGTGAGSRHRSGAVKMAVRVIEESEFDEVMKRAEPLKLRQQCAPHCPLWLSPLLPPSPLPRSRGASAWQVRRASLLCSRPRVPSARAAAARGRHARRAIPQGLQRDGRAPLTLDARPADRRDARARLLLVVRALRHPPRRVDAPRGGARSRL